MAFIRMQELMDELIEWGLKPILKYSEEGDGWYFEVKNENSNFEIHRAFEYNQEIYARTSQLVVENKTVSPIKFDNALMIAEARVQWLVNNRSKQYIADFCNEKYS